MPFYSAAVVERTKRKGVKKNIVYCFVYNKRNNNMVLLFFQKKIHCFSVENMCADQTAIMVLRMMALVILMCVLGVVSCFFVVVFVIVCEQLQ